MDADRWLRAIRRVRRLSQRELAALADVPSSTVSRIEAGRHHPSTATFAALVAAAGYRLALIDHKGRLLAVDDEHDAIRDRRGRRFPAHLLWGGRPDYWNGPYWWGWHRIAWYWPDEPAVPDHVFRRRRRRLTYGRSEPWMDAT